MAQACTIEARQCLPLSPPHLPTLPGFAFSRLALIWQILSFNEISRLDGLAELQRLRHLDLGYNVIEGVYRHLPNGSGISTTPGQAVTAAGIEAAATATTGRDHHPPDPPPDPSFSDGFVALPKLKPRHDGSSRRSTQVADEYSTTAVKHLVMLPALTRLDLNDNILHDLDDLKV